MPAPVSLSEEFKTAFLAPAFVVAESSLAAVRRISGNFLLRRHSATKRRLIEKTFVKAREAAADGRLNTAFSAAKETAAKSLELLLETRGRWMGKLWVRESEVQSRQRELEALREFPSSENMKVMDAVAPLFDVAFYKEKHPEVSGSFAEVLHHYVEKGEGMGWWPCATFDPGHYLSSHIDVVLLSEFFARHPFYHYATLGREEGRGGVPPFGCLTLSAPDFEAAKFSENVGIAVHLFYEDVWPEIKQLGVYFPPNVRWYINLVKGRTEHLAESLQNEFPSARLQIHENKGRDVLPFLSQISQMHADGIGMALKLHTKKSLHTLTRLGDGWRKALYKELAASKSMVNAVLESFEMNPDVGLMSSSSHIQTLSHCLRENRTQVCELAWRMGVSLEGKNLNEIPFAVGTMFWFRPAALMPLTQLGLTGQDFPPEQGQTDGTVAHALERLTCLAASAAGFRTVPYLYQ